MTDLLQYWPCKKCLAGNEDGVDCYLFMMVIFYGVHYKRAKNMRVCYWCLNLQVSKILDHISIQAVLENLFKNYKEQETIFYGNIGDFSRCLKLLYKSGLESCFCLAAQCSQTCGAGHSTRYLRCSQLDSHRRPKIVDDRYCQNIPKPAVPLTKPCSIMPCLRISQEVQVSRWNVRGWSQVCL